MDIAEEFYKLSIDGKNLEIREFFEKYKDVIYPPDRHMWTWRYGIAEDAVKSVECLGQSTVEEDVIHNLTYKIIIKIQSGLLVKVNNILNNPPQNTQQLDELRINASDEILEIIHIYEQIVEETENFDPKRYTDGYIHFDYGLEIWKNVFRSRVTDFQAMYHFVLLEPEKMILSAEQTVELCEGELKGSMYHLVMLNNLAIFYRVVKDIEKERKTLFYCIDLMEDLITISGIDAEIHLSTMQAYTSLGGILSVEGDLLDAEKYFQRYVDLTDSGEGYLHLTRLYIDSGDLHKAEIHLEEANNKFDSNKKDELQAQYNTEKARVNYLTGISSTSEINTAIELIEKHLEENGFITSVPTIETYFRVADYYMANLDLDEAKEYYSKVSDMCKIVYYHDFKWAECLMKLIQISCIQKTDTENHKIELDKLVEDYSQHQKMVLYQQLAEGIILKNAKGKNRGKSRFKSQAIFEKISHDKIYNINLHFFARFNYCELLLDEYQFYEDNEIFEELFDEVENLTSMSKNKGLYLFYIDALILKSKILTLQKDLVSALDYLEKAQKIADTRNLKIYQDRIKLEKQTYLQNLDSWNSMKKDEKIKSLRLRQYLKFAQQNITK